MIVDQKAPAKGSYTVSEQDGQVVVSTKNVRACVDKQTGEVSFFDANGNVRLKEAKDGKLFKDFTVPEREYGLKGGPAITEEMKLAAAKAIASLVPEDKLCDDYILPEAFAPHVADVVAEAVKQHI
jgi:alpha-D-xyloside xylohydrolase